MSFIDNMQLFINSLMQINMWGMVPRLRYKTSKAISVIKLIICLFTRSAFDVYDHVLNVIVIN